MCVVINSIVFPDVQGSSTAYSSPGCDDDVHDIDVCTDGNQHPCIWTYAPILFIWKSTLRGMSICYRWLQVFHIIPLILNILFHRHNTFGFSYTCYSQLNDYDMENDLAGCLCSFLTLQRAWFGVSSCCRTWLHRESALV